MSIISKFNHISCQKSIHPWSSSCIGASVSLIRPSILGSFKLYASLFLVSI